MQPYEKLCSKLQEEDYIVCVDSQKHSGNTTDFIGDEVACVDHHPTFIPIESLWIENGHVKHKTPGILELKKFSIGASSVRKVPQCLVFQYSLFMCVTV